MIRLITSSRESVLASKLIVTPLIVNAPFPLPPSLMVVPNWALSSELVKLARPKAPVLETVPVPLL